MIQPKELFTFKEVDNSDIELLQRIFKLRVVCRNDDGYITFKKYPNGWFDNEDFKAKHFVAFDGDKLIAAARVEFYENINVHPYYPAFEGIGGLPVNEPIAILSRIVVLPEYRHHEISRELVLEREVYITQRKIKNILAYVRTFQIQNFIHYGFKNIGILNVAKIHWELEPDFYLMHKILY